VTEIPLSEFRATGAGLGPADQAAIAETAAGFLRSIYVHSPGLAEREAEDAIADLQALSQGARAAEHGERAFHDRMVSIFKGLRDAHTHYLLGDPFRGNAAVLPFSVGDFHEGGKRGYVVTASTPEAPVRPGDRLLAWNGIAIEEMLAARAQRTDGARADARHARALASLTVRPAWLLPLPEEDEVILRFLRDGAECEERIGWRVRSGYRKGADDETLLSSTDPLLEAIRLHREEAGPAMAKAAEDADLPSRLEAEEIGYIRLTGFGGGEDQFIEALLSALDPEPRRGFVIDLRSNGGGYIPAGEALIQLFTPAEVAPARWLFRATPTTLEFTRALAAAERYPADVRRQMAAYVPSLERAVAEGSRYSDALEATPSATANRVGQVYGGPVLVITDALTYSTAELLAAGLQDVGAAEILCLDEATGGGGSNDILYDLLPRLLPETFPQLNPVASFRLSARASLRTGAREGIWLERDGVAPDHRHRATLDDRLAGEPDLAEAAASILRARGEGCALRFEVSAATAGEVALNITARNLSRVEVLVDRKLVQSLDLDDGSRTLVMPAPDSEAALELRGYDGATLRFRRKGILAPAPSTPA
jgi:hypothetical protein